MKCDWRTFRSSMKDDKVKVKMREYRVVIKFKCQSETVEKGIGLVKEAMKVMGLNATSVKHISDLKSDSQRNALHLWFDQIATEAEVRGQTVDMWIKHPTEMKITESLLKDSFRAIGKKLYGWKSTEDAKKDELAVVVKIFDKAVLERLGINIPFPSIDVLIDRDLNNNKK